MRREWSRQEVVRIGIGVVLFMCMSFCNCRAQEACGRCGAFGVCGPRSCGCLPGFIPRNNEEWWSGNWSSGCERSLPLSLRCEEDRFMRVSVSLPSWSSQRWFEAGDECEGGCLRNCSCLAYAHYATGCAFWTGPTLINILRSPTSQAFIRLSRSQHDPKKDSKNITIIVIAVIVAVFLIISISTYLSWKWIAKRNVRKRTLELANAGASDPVDTSVQDALSRINLEELPVFKLEILANATNNFSEATKLGKGGFGVVYKGELLNGREIAVKRLSQASGQGLQEFMNEVILISKLQHRNLVKLLGCCVENREMMLVYEYMPNKSLDFYLLDPSQDILDWKKRFNIIEGICRGLLYLHRDSRLKIIHRDLKPSNILLDNDWNPKISDFGMARLYGTRQDHVSTIRVVGTYGYMAPEYAIEGRFSEKSDVFSFGVLLLQIATGRKNKTINEDGSLNLLGHVWNMWKENSFDALIDPRISSLSYRAEVIRCIHIGLLCVQELPKDRPSVSAVLSMLSSETTKLHEPKQSAYSLESKSSHTGTSSSRQSQKSSSSMNYVSLTTVDGR